MDMWIRKKKQKYRKDKENIRDVAWKIKGLEKFNNRSRIGIAIKSSAGGCMT